MFFSIRYQRGQKRFISHGSPWNVSEASRSNVLLNSDFFSRFVTNRRRWSRRAAVASFSFRSFEKGVPFSHFGLQLGLSQSIARSVLCGLVHRRDTLCMTRSHKRAKIPGERKRKDGRRFFRLFSARRLISFVPPNFSRMVVLIGQPGESAIFVNSNYPLIIHSPVASPFLLFTFH